MQITTDSRNDWQKMRRTDLWRLAEAWKIAYPPGAPKDDMINILIANQVNPNDPRGAFEWEVTHTQDESGNSIVIKEPRRRVHATANSNIDYEGIMDKQAQDEMETENSSLRNEVDELKAMMAKMLEPKVNHDSDEQIVFSELKFHELKKIAKQKGLVIQNTMKKVELIKELEALG